MRIDDEPLEPDEEREVVRQSMAGDVEARRRLAMTAMTLAPYWAKRYRRRGIPTDDLVAEGHLAVVEAAALYRGDVPFRQHASPLVRAAVRCAVMAFGGVVGVSRHGSSLARRWRDAKATLEDYCGREPSDDEIARFAGLKDDEARTALAALAARQANLEPRTASHEPVAPADESPVDRDAVAAVTSALATLTEAERAEVQRAHGLTDEPQTRGTSGTAWRTRRAAEQKLRDALAG